MAPPRAAGGGGSPFLRHLAVLLRKNCLLQRRAPLATALEFLLPIAFVAVMVAIWAPPTFVDTINPAAEYSSRNSQRVWPLQALGARLRLTGEALAIVPFSPAQAGAAAQLAGWLSENYPGISFTNNASAAGAGAGAAAAAGSAALWPQPAQPELAALEAALGPLPPLSAALATNFASEQALLDHILADDYGRDGSPHAQKVWAAIVVYAGASEGAWDYAVRMNFSNGQIMDTSWTLPYYDPLQQSPNQYGYGSLSTGYSRYTPPFNDPAFGERPNSLQFGDMPGFLSLQLAVDRFIINRSAPFAACGQDCGADVSALAVLMDSALGAVVAACGAPGGVGSPTCPWDGGIVTQWPLWPTLQNLSSPDAAVADAARDALGNFTASLAGFMRAESFAPQRVSATIFPTASYRDNSFYPLVSGVLPLFMTLSFLYPVSRLMRSIVSEKEMRLKEGMLQMGLGGFALNASWVLTYFLLFAIIAAACAALASLTFFSRSNYFVVFVLFLLLGWSATCWCFLVSTFFSAAKTASSVGVATYFVLIFPLTAATNSAATAAIKVGCSFASSSAFGLALGVITKLEASERGATWAGLGEVIGQYSLASGFALMAADCLIYLVLGAYFEAVLPSAWGVQRPFYFPFTPAFWREVWHVAADALGVHSAGGAAEASALQGAFRVSPEEPVAEGDGAVAAGAGAGAAAGVSVGVGAGASSAHVEPYGAELRAKLEAQQALSVRTLRKAFSTPDGKKVAVDGVDLDIFEGQILVLLGHNGAGKTTTIAMLIGMLQADSGRMGCFGLDLTTKAGMRALRAQLGVCPQHDVLWPELTVREHLEIFADIKGVARAERDAEIRRAIAEVGLTEKARAPTSSLSGGMKRKLSVAIALLGGSRVVLLDEPTSGMDPYSRRSTWQMLRNAREGRIVLLTTHFMDEADVLGDRIAIMAHGKVRCAGSPGFLKRAYSVGYQMTITLAPSAAGGGASCRVFDDIVARHVPGAGAASGIGSEVIVQLPFEAKKLSALFRELEQRSAELGIASFSASVTTAEAIFLRVAKEADVEKKAAGGVGESLLRDEADPVAAEAMAAPADVNVRAGGTDVDEAVFGSTPKRPGACLAGGIGAGGGGAIVAPPHGVGDAAWERVLKRARRSDETCAIFLQHLRALLFKRASAAKRDYRNICCSVIVPLLTLFLGFSLITAAFGTSQGNLPMSTSNYNVGSSSADYARPVHPFVLPAFEFKRGYRNASGAGGAFAAAAGGPLRLSPSLPRSADIGAWLSCMPPGNVSHVTAAGRDMWLSPSGAEAAVNGDPYGFVPSPAMDPCPDCEAMGAALLNTRGESAGSVFGALVFDSPFDRPLFPGPAANESFSGLRLPPELLWQPPFVLPPPASAGAAGVGAAPLAVDYVVMANSTAPHAAALVLNLANSALYQWSRQPGSAPCAWPAGASGAADAARRITVRNFPLPTTATEKAQTQSVVSGLGATFAMIGLAFVPAAVAAGVVKERETGAKHQQRISGVGVAAYWLSHFAFDYAVYIVTGLSSIGIYEYFKINDYVSPAGGRLGALFALYMLYGAAVIPFAYLLSFAFRNHSGAQNSILIANIVTGAILIIVDFILSNVPTAGGKACKAEIALQYVWRLFPSFSLGHGLYRLSYLEALPAINANCPRAYGATISADDLKPISAWHPTCAGVDVAYLAAACPAYLALVIALDAALGRPNLRLVAEALFGCRLRVLARLLRGAADADVDDDLKTTDRGATAAAAAAAALPSPGEDREDEDVAAEAARVAAEVAREAATGGREGTSDVIQLRGLRKVYPAGAGGGRTGGKPKVAVRGLSFGVPVGEVFGFLGINGAGKSTSMGVLTGETLPTRGTAKLAGLDIVRQQPQVRRLVGYCPQFDALIDNLTLREHLLLFARIKGVPEGAPLAAAVAASMHELGITEFAHKLAARRAGGTQRKLCLAIALICRPPLLVLDEPTTGVDAISRRHIWKTLQTIANRDRLCSILLTTHSMEEAEALCTRVGIMVGGRLRCLGTCQHLKARHGSGYQLDIRVRNAPAADIARALAAFGAPPSGLMLPQAAIAQLCRRLGAPRRAAALAPSDEEAAAGPGAALGGAGSASGAGEGEVVVGGAQALAIARAAGVGIRAALAAGGGELAATAFAEWWANEDAADAAIRFVCADAFPGAHVVERHGASLRFNVPSADARGRRRVLSESFETLEAGAARLGLETFTLGVTSLESVFLGFAGQQEEETAPAPGMISRIFMRK